MKKIILLLAAMLMCGAQASAAELDAVSEWKYMSYSFGTEDSDDIIIGGIRLFKEDELLSPVNPSEENENCSYISNTAKSDASVYRTKKGGADCMAAVKHYCPQREKGKRIVPGYIYFDAGSDITPEDKELTFEVEYFDEGTDKFGILYENENSGLSRIDIARTGTNQWKKVKKTVTDACFNADRPTALGDRKCDFRIEADGREAAIRKIELYNHYDAVSGRSYKMMSLGKEQTARTYFTQGMWTADSKKIILNAADGRLYEYNTGTEETKSLVKSSADFYVTPNNNLYYINTSKKTINRINLDTYAEEILTSYPPGAVNSPNYIHVNSSDTKLTVLFNENSSPLDVETNESGKPERRNRRIPVYDIPSGMWDLRYTHEFPSGTPHMTHLMINPVYDNLVYFCHEGTTTKIPDRMWTIDTNTGEQKNIFIQQPNSLGSDSEIKTGETSGHENWTADGEHMVFVKYPYNTNVGMNGIVRIDKYGENREYINDDYRYWHCHPSADNRFITADTMMSGITQGENVNMGFGSSDIVLVDSKTSSSKLLAEIKCGVTHPYQPHPAFSPNGRLVAFACVNEEELLCVGIMDVTDLTAGKDGESFCGNTNEDKGALVSEITNENGRTSVSIFGTGIENRFRLFGASYESTGELKEVSAASAAVGQSEEKKLETDAGGKAFLWTESGIPMSFAPTAPEKLRAAEISAYNVKLNWNRPLNLSDNEIKYEIYRNNEKIAESETGWYNDCNIEGDTEYVYEVCAVYPHGTVSPRARLKLKTKSGRIYSVIAANGEENGMIFLKNSDNPRTDSYTEKVSIGGKECRKSTSQIVEGKEKTGKFYFRTSESFVKKDDRNITFSVTYYDLGTGDIFAEYNAADGSVAKRAKIAKRGNTQKWITAEVSVSDACFVHSPTLSGCDFRIEGGADTYIYEVVLKNSAVHTPCGFTVGKFTAGENMTESGMTFFKGNSGDSAYTLTEKGGRKCVYTAAGKNMYFGVDDSFIYGDAKHGVSIEIEYFDEGSSDIILHYNTNDPTYTGNAAYKSAVIGKCGGSGQWKKLKTVFVDTYFTNMQDAPYKADFRITSSAGLCVSGVKVKEMP